MLLRTDSWQPTWAWLFKGRGAVLAPPSRASYNVRKGQILLYDDKMTILYNTQDGQSSFPIGQNSLPKGRLWSGENRASQTMAHLLAFHASQIARLTQPRPRKSPHCGDLFTGLRFSLVMSTKNKTSPRGLISFLVEQIDPNTNIQSYVGGLAITIIL